MMGRAGFRHPTLYRQTGRLARRPGGRQEEVKADARGGCGKEEVKSGVRGGCGGGGGKKEVEQLEEDKEQVDSRSGRCGGSAEGGGVEARRERVAAVEGVARSWWVVASDLGVAWLVMVVGGFLWGRGRQAGGECRRAR